MHQPKFFHLGSGTSLPKLAEWAPGEIETEKVICPINDGHQRGGKRLNNLSIIISSKKIEDIVWSWYSECLLTDRTLELFKANGFTGFEVKPVKARWKGSKEQAPRLWELVATGSAGIAPPESGIRLMQHCPGCNLSYYSSCTNPDKLIDVHQWDGSDFFTVWPVGKYIFVTERVAKTIRDKGITGVVLKAPDDLDFSGNRTGKISVDASSYPMPKNRLP